MPRLRVTWNLRAELKTQVQTSKAPLEMCRAGEFSEQSEIVAKTFSFTRLVLRERKEIAAR